MNKRLISLLLVIVMICTLLPVSVLAGDDDNASTETSGNFGSAMEAFMSALEDVMTTANTDRQTEDEIKEGLTKETGAVVVPVFGKELSDVLREGNFFKYTEEALQVRLSDKSVIPDVEVVITGNPDDPNTSEIKKTLKESDVSTKASGNVGSAVEAFMSELQELLLKANTDRQTEDEIKEGLGEGKGAVVVPVFGKELSDILREGHFFEYTEDALQVRLSDKSVIPDVEVIITGDPNDPNTKGIQKELKESDLSILYALKSVVNIDYEGNDFFLEHSTILK